MRQIGRCDCGNKGIKLKFNSWVCERCDRIEKTVVHDLHKISEQEKQRDKENHWTRYQSNSYLE